MFYVMVRTVIFYGMVRTVMLFWDVPGFKSATVFQMSTK